jgi:hypothetical protein
MIAQFKRFIVIVLSFFMIAVMPHQQVEPLDMAVHMPSVDLFASLQTDVNTITRLDTLLLRVSQALPITMDEPLTFSGMMSQALGIDNLGLDVMAILTSIIGDYVAIGVNILDDGSLINPESLVIHIVTPLENYQPLEGFLTLTLPDATVQNSADYTIYTLLEQETVLALSKTNLHITIGSTAANIAPSPTLADDDDFKQAMATLPDTGYEALFYASTGRFMRDLRPDPAIREIFAALGFQVDTLGAMAVGFQINDVQALSVDVVQQRDTALTNDAASPDSSFARHIPADVDFFAHTTDINQLIDTLSGLIASLSSSTTRADIYQQIENLVSLLLDLNLQADILPWASGNYGVIGFLPDDSVRGLQIGALLEVADTIAAKALVDAMAETIMRLSDGSTLVTPTRIGSAAQDNAYIISFEDSRFGREEVAIGVHDHILFIATHEIIPHLFDDGRVLSETVAYQESRALMLSDAHLLVFVADRAPGKMVRLLLELFEPLRFVFDPEIADLIMDAAPDFFVNVASSSGMSAAVVPSGDLIFRFTLSLDN